MPGPTPPQTPKPLVVLVEDDTVLRNALAFSLKIEGYRVEICESGEALLQMPRPLGPTCLVVDQRLSGVTGIVALRVLRGRGVALPAILITTQPGPLLRALAGEFGVRIVEKPLLDAELFAAIAEELAR